MRKLKHYLRVVTDKGALNEHGHQIVLKIIISSGEMEKIGEFCRECKIINKIKTEEG